MEANTRLTGAWIGITCIQSSFVADSGRERLLEQDPCLKAFGPPLVTWGSKASLGMYLPANYQSCHTGHLPLRTCSESKQLECGSHRAEWEAELGV